MGTSSFLSAKRLNKFDSRIPNPTPASHTVSTTCRACRPLANCCVKSYGWHLHLCVCASATPQIPVGAALKLMLPCGLCKRSVWRPYRCLLILLLLRKCSGLNQTGTFGVFFSFSLKIWGRYIGLAQTVIHGVYFSLSVLKS